MQKAGRADPPRTWHFRPRERPSPSSGSREQQGDRPPSRSVSSQDPWSPIAGSYVCLLPVSRFRREPRSCAPARRWERLCCSQRTEATRVQSNPAPQGKAAPGPVPLPRLGVYSTALGEVRKGGRTPGNAQMSPPSSGRGHKRGKLEDKSLAPCFAVEEDAHHEVAGRPAG